MKLKEIEAFDAFMKHGTTKAAAEALAISQSMVSRLLSGLEEELGFALFKRSRNQLAPTEEAFLYHASVLRLMASIREDCNPPYSKGTGSRPYRGRSRGGGKALNTVPIEMLEYF